MDTSVIVNRLRQFPGAGGLEHLDGFDPGNDVHIDEAALMLLHRFREHEDSDAFSLLFELTHRRLGQIARSVSGRLMPSADPDDLISVFMGRLFTDAGRCRGETVRRFFALAHTSMRNDVLDQMRRAKRTQNGLRDFGDTLDAPADPACVVEHDEQDRRLNAFAERLVEMTDDCFATLEAREKHVLVAREILGLSYDRLAVLLDLPTNQIGMVLRRARQRLAERLSGRLAAEHQTTASDRALRDAQLAVLRSLSCKERMRHVRTLVRRTLESSLSRGRRPLANILYELTARALTSRRGRTSRGLLNRLADNRGTDVDARELAKQVDGILARSGERSKATSALPEVELCLRTLGRAEGTSLRLRVAQILKHAQSGEPERAEKLLARLRGRRLATPSRRPRTKAPPALLAAC